MKTQLNETTRLESGPFARSTAKETEEGAERMLSGENDHPRLDQNMCFRWRACKVIE